MALNAQQSELSRSRTLVNDQPVAGWIACLAIAALLFPPFYAHADSSSPDRQVPEIKWDTTLRKFQFDADKFVGQRLTVKLPPVSVVPHPDGVAGTGAYPSDSAIGIAALHAGVITTDGGIVTLQLNPGQEKYVGSESNGITTGNRPATSRSIAFISKESREEQDDIRLEHLPRIDWNTKFTATGYAHRHLVGQRFAFRIPEKGHDRRLRLVFGTDKYDFASNVCTAALHAGRVSLGGGIVTVQINSGRVRLVGSLRNGVETKSKGGGDRYLTFVDDSLVFTKTDD